MKNYVFTVVQSPRRQSSQVAGPSMFTPKYSITDALWCNDAESPGKDFCLITSTLGKTVHVCASDLWPHAEWKAFWGRQGLLGWLAANQVFCKSEVFQEAQWLYSKPTQRGWERPLKLPVLLCWGPALEFPWLLTLHLCLSWIFKTLHFEKCAVP